VQRRHHHELAFEAHLRERRVPYLAVDEARRILLPPGATFRVERSDGAAAGPGRLKSFDFALYAPGNNLLIDVKGRRMAPSTRDPTVARSRLECWVTRDDVDSLLAWQALFGEGFRSAFAFVYWSDELPPEALFEELFQFRGRWYAVRAVLVEAYARHMRERSPRWRTVDLAPADFAKVSGPLLGPTAGAVPEPLPRGG
jgi:hypothetical protein